MSCGPVNSLQKLSNHAQVDRSLQHEPQQRHHAPSASFRTQQPNTLERDFQAHQQGLHHFEPSFNPGFQAPVRQFPQQQVPRAAASSWANDFKLNDPMANAHPVQQGQGWNAQFMNHMNAQNQQQQSVQVHAQTQSQAQAQAQMQHHLQQSRLNSTMYTPQLSQNYSLAGTSRMTEHQELHSAHLHSQLEKMDDEYAALDKEFDNLEREFQNVKVDEPALKAPQVDIPPGNNAGFREAAKQVADVMKSTDSSRFANSRFLDLMNRVSAGQVSLNEDETKLVDTQGNDIHELSSQNVDPSQQQSAGGSHAHLPDPLEFVKDGELETPFQAAKLVGDQHGEKYTWDDVYNDYRNDDSSF